MPSLLEKAEKTVQSTQKDVNKQWYPSYHLAPQVGWMNDPNGLVYANGWYHAFYQYHPYSAVWGPMHWGHARSKDMVHWEHLPIALAPEGPEDKDGCFSGSAVEDGDQLALIYTGHQYHGPESDENQYQVQCLATSKDGIHFDRKGMVIPTPPGLHHFRDPKVWREDGEWYLIAGARENDQGDVRLYRSSDLEHWKAAGTLTRADASMGFMWECPDFFKLGDKRVLLFSPQGIEAKGFNYRNLFQSGYMVGDWQPGTELSIDAPFQELDHGHDFYAPQTFSAKDGRRIVIGWLDMWESPMPEQQDKWCGQFTIPRELTLTKSLKLLQTPVKELESLREACQSIESTELKSQQIEIAGECASSELLVKWDLSSSTAEQYGISLGEGLRVYVDAQSHRLVQERTYPELKLCGQRSIPLPKDKELTLRLFFDRSSVEVFVNDGEACLSSRIYPTSRELCLFAWTGSAKLVSGSFWQLKGMASAKL